MPKFFTVNSFARFHGFCVFIRFLLFSKVGISYFGYFLPTQYCRKSASFALSFAIYYPQFFCFYCRTPYFVCVCWCVVYMALSSAYCHSMIYIRFTFNILFLISLSVWAINIRSILQETNTYMYYIFLLGK